MFNETTVKVPSISTTSTHTVGFVGIGNVPLESTFFITASNFSSSAENKFSSSTPRLPIGTQLIVLEHGLGYKAEWSKVKVGVQVGYVKNSAISPLNENIKPFFNLNTNSEFAPDACAEEINWKKQQPNIPYDDALNGVYAVHVELENVTEVGNGNPPLEIRMEEARRTGTELIIKNLGFKINQTLLNKLLNNYYLFSRAEDWFFEPRPCSTLRVVVAIPKRYLFSKNTDLIKENEVASNDVILFDDNQPAPTPQTQQSSIDRKPAPDGNIVITFRTYDEYKTFFDKLITTLERFHLPFYSKSWVTDPVGITIIFSAEASNIKKFVELTNDLISLNQPQTTELKTFNPLLKPEKVWKNSLKFLIDPQNLKIKKINYFSNDKILSLNNNLINYFRSPEIMNRTTINYLLSFDPETDFYDPFADAAQAVANNVANPPSSPLDLLTQAEQVFGSALKGIGAGDIDSDISGFLIKNHYPKISSITAQPVDLLECTVDTLQRVKYFESIKLQSEREKWFALNAAYEAQKLGIEGDLFIRSVIQRDFVKDRNLRILLGIDTLPGKTPAQKLNTYVSIARSMDWAKFLGIAAQCLSQSIPPEVLLELMQKYKEARKFIEQILLASVCNPYLKNGLKIINGFELPTITVYNPNEVLARELQSAFIKIVNDLIAFGIKKALEAAAKACTSNPNTNFNANSNLNFNDSLNDAAGGADSLQAALSADDPEISNTVNNLSKSPSSVNAAATVQNTTGAEEKIQNIIQDITSCLTLRELCGLYNGAVVNDEVYQIIISLVKRKYGATDAKYVEAFSSREQIKEFFKALGRNMDLTICQDIAEPELPTNNTNILCDDGKLRDLRDKLLSDKGLTPELVQQSLDALKQDETKALEDVLKLLNSENPLDFCQVPDLGCKVFPSGETIAPSMESFNNLLNPMLRSVYDSFDREAAEWYKTTYSVSSSKPNIVKYDDGNDRVVPKQLSDSDKETLFAKQKKSILANKASSPPKEGEGEDFSSEPTGNEEIKHPAYVFKETLKNSNSFSFGTDNDSSINFSSKLNGNLQQDLELKILNETQESFKGKIQEAEIKLTNFAQLLWFKVNEKYKQDFQNAVIAQKADPLFDFSQTRPFRELSTSGGLGVLKALDIYLRSNQSDSETLRINLNNAYTVLGLNEAQESNGFFAAENASAVYLAICEQINKIQTQATIKEFLDSSVGLNDGYLKNKKFPPNSGSLRSVLTACLTDWVAVKRYYKTIIRMKISYPDFDVNYKFGLKALETDRLFKNNNFYDVQTLEVYKNSKNYIKFKQVDEVSADIKNFINNLGQLNSAYTKESLFLDFIKTKTNNSPAGAFSFINDKIKNHIKNKIISQDNKFLYLKEFNSSGRAVVSEKGIGDPYTHYLKLVVPQTPAQKACGIRPHYLDIDSIKDDILSEKSKKLCIEKPADNKSLGTKPINSNQLKDLETNSTQDALLFGLNKLNVRIALHDIVLRSIAIFGVYDPQSLRDDETFISFMAKQAEADMKAMDNNTFNVLTESLLKSHKKQNPNDQRNDEILKSDLFRELVKSELKNYVLLKLAKRINSDTNLTLLNNYPIDSAIKLIHIEDDILNMGIIEKSGNQYSLKLSANNSVVIYNGTDFKNSNEFKFLFKFIFPVSHFLTAFFITNCLATSTNKQTSTVFSGTKRDVLATTKLVQTNGQAIVSDSNDIQSSAIDPMDIILGFLIQTLFNTPRLVLKGIAESSEPNIALTSNIFKIARIFVPNLTSFLIPAVSIPLGTIITPLTCPLPFMNPILAIAYFATLAWYDDKPLNQNNLAAGKELEDKITNDIDGEVSKTASPLTSDANACADTKNTDNFYLDGQTKINGIYDVNQDFINNINSKFNDPNRAPEADAKADAPETPPVAVLENKQTRKIAVSFAMPRLMRANDKFGLERFVAETGQGQQIFQTDKTSFTKSFVDVIPAGFYTISYKTYLIRDGVIGTKSQPSNTITDFNQQTANAAAAAAATQAAADAAAAAALAAKNAAIDDIVNQIRNKNLEFSYDIETILNGRDLILTKKQTKKISELNPLITGSGTSRKSITYISIQQIRTIVSNKVSSDATFNIQSQNFNTITNASLNDTVLSIKNQLVNICNQFSGDTYIAGTEKLTQVP